MTEERTQSVSLIRLYLVRIMYAMIAFLMGTNIWRALIVHGEWDRWHGVGVSMLAALALLSLLGLRYPLKMLPLLLFELVWKVLFIGLVALPAKRAGLLDAATQETMMECLFGIVILPFILPWRYVWREYLSPPFAATRRNADGHGAPRNRR